MRAVGFLRRRLVFDRPIGLFAALWFILFAGAAAQAQVTPERLVNAGQEPANWLTYSGTYAGDRYSTLDQITSANVKNLELKWVYQGAVAGGWQTSPLVVDGIMYITQRPNDVVALDARTGRVFWIYHYPLGPAPNVCCGANNRGLAILGDTLFMGTLDAHLVAIDAKTGRPLWNITVADSKAGYSITHAPLVIKDKVLVGMGGGEFGIRGFIAAFDAKTGKEDWRFNTIPAPGEPGSETWEKCPPNPKTLCDPDAWMHGGGSVWVTGSYDPQLNLTYWGVGNAGPDYNNQQRPGDDLYAGSVVALDADTGKLKWHYQFTPHDQYDFDSVQIPVLADITWKGQPVKAMLWANRNGFFYVLDRATGRFLLGKPFAKVNWASGIDDKGVPIQTPQPPGQPTWPGNQGATNWFSPSYSPRTQLFYLSVWDDYATIFSGYPSEFSEGRGFGGGALKDYEPIPNAPGLSRLGQRPPINNWTETAGHGSVIAIDPLTGEHRWRFAMTDVSDSGILTTGGDVLFTGGREGYFQALDAKTGALLWKASLGSEEINGPITYQVDGKQYVATVSGMALTVFGLRE
ncbi:MAG TPA: PQQ-dependent dehydrogenase, methanol/ethanol family [Caulobacteraceae bacterium]|nr:PQQ-dependent dehydrogenase, methanol/ethanol family [Caulobacteraceae bacterium]